MDLVSWVEVACRVQMLWLVDNEKVTRNELYLRDRSALLYVLTMTVQRMSGVIPQ